MKRERRGLVLTGAGLSIGAMLCGVSGLAGVYLPFSSTGRGGRPPRADAKDV